jgi:integrase/recombinase XerC
MINEFLQYLQYEKNYSSHTVLSYHNDLLQFCDFVQQDPCHFRIGAVESTHVQQWVLFLMSGGLKAFVGFPQNIYAEVILGAFFSAMGLRPQIRFPESFCQSRQSRFFFFKDNEMLQALDETFLAGDFVSVRNHLIVFMLYATGMRRSELLMLTDADFDLDAGSVKVLGKRNKQRIIPIGLNFPAK